MSLHRDSHVPLVTKLRVKPALSSKPPLREYLRTYDYVLGIVPGAWVTAPNKAVVPALTGPTSSREGLDNKQ